MGLLHHYVELEHPGACTLDEAQAHADRLRGAGIDVSIVEAYSPSGQNLLTGRSSLAPGTPQLWVLRVPKDQHEAALRA